MATRQPTFQKKTGVVALYRIVRISALLRQNAIPSSAVQHQQENSQYAPSSRLKILSRMSVITNATSTLVTASGKITCLRCTAISKRSGEQRKKPALKTSRTQKSGFQGGRSTGPKTEADKARQRAAVLKTSDYTTLRY